MREYLQRESELLLNADEDGYSHYRLVRDRFNINHDPYDFIFLSRAGFNGMMRFNGRGEWNIPFCKKPNRFASAYITKICNQINGVANVIQKKDWTFINSDFEEIINQAKEGDLIYCDPPYYGRYVDYFNSWTEQDEERLFIALSNTKAKFILSTWHHNEFRSNDMIEKYWNKFNIITREHFYHGGGKIENRHAMVEALVFNFDYKHSCFWNCFN
jgi:DNA adenine methylase